MEFEEQTQTISSETEGPSAQNTPDVEFRTILLVLPVSEVNWF